MRRQKVYFYSFSSFAKPAKITSSSKNNFPNDCCQHKERMYEARRKNQSIIYVITVINFGEKWFGGGVASQRGQSVMERQEESTTSGHRNSEVDCQWKLWLLLETCGEFQQQIFVLNYISMNTVEVIILDSKYFTLVASRTELQV